MVRPFYLKRNGEGTGLDVTYGRNGWQSEKRPKTGSLALAAQQRGNPPQGKNDEEYSPAARGWIGLMDVLGHFC
jgi:hypothetical protein